MSDEGLVYRVRNWDLTAETKSSLRRGGSLATVKIASGLGKLAEQKLWLLPTGAAAYGIWIVILRVAATCTRRGVLADDGVPLVAQDFTALTGIPVAQIQHALEVLSGPDIRLLEQVPLDVALQPPEIPVVQPKSRPPVKRDIKPAAVSEPDEYWGHEVGGLADEDQPAATAAGFPNTGSRRTGPATNPLLNALSVPLPPLVNIAQPYRRPYDDKGRSARQQWEEIEREAKYLMASK